MTKDNQKKLYSHFKELAKDGATDKIRMRAAKRAAELLRIYPDFEETVEKPVEGTKTSPDKKKKFPCSKCKKVCKSKIGLISHMKTHKPETPAEKPEAEEKK